MIFSSMDDKEIKHRRGKTPTAKIYGYIYAENCHDAKIISPLSTGRNRVKERRSRGCTPNVNSRHRLWGSVSPRITQCHCYSICITTPHRFNATAAVSSLNAFCVIEGAARYGNVSASAVIISVSRRIVTAIFE